MGALILTLKNNPQSRLNCGEITPDRLTDLSADQIKVQKLGSGNNVPLLGDYFEVSGNDANHIIFKNTSAQCDYIGYKMKLGQITVEGNAGDFLGANMRGGQIICRGDAGDRVADQMRRGLILIDGDAGDYCASRMIAGTVGVYGKVGAHLGFSLRRGTLLLTQTPAVQASWQDCGMHTLPFLSLLFAAFKPLDSKFAKLNNARIQRWMGDVSQNGKGEILLVQP